MIFNLTPPESTAVEFIEQTLTDTQKAQARTNIGALSIDDVPSGKFLVYNITTASYKSNKYSIPLTYSRYIYLLNGQAKSTKSSYSDISECTSFGFIIKDSAKILSWNFREANTSYSYYGEIEVNYDDLIYHQSSRIPTGTAIVAQVSNNNLLFGAGNISYYDADGGGPWTSPYNFIGTIYLMPV